MKELLLTNSRDVALLDDEDYERLRLYPWRKQTNANGKVYVVRTRSRKEAPGSHLVKLHREIVSAPAGCDVDHVDNNGLNNQSANLRVCTRSENLRNTRKRDNSSAKFKGIYWHKRARKWVAQIKPPTGHIYLGSFADDVEAAKAYDAKARELFGAFAKCNFEVAS